MHRLRSTDDKFATTSVIRQVIMQHESQTTIRLEGELSELFVRAKLPSSPAIATQILSLIDNPNSTAPMFARVIEADPGLAARLLRIANTAQFAQRSGVTNIRRAVTVFGMRQLRVIVLGFELIQHVNQLGEVPFNLRSFWRQSLLRACLGREIARRTAPSVGEEAFLVGLLQDCGVLALVQTMGSEYAQFMAAVEGSAASAFEQEREAFAHNHVDAIGAMASIWGLPSKIAEPLMHQHVPTTLKEGASDEARLNAISFLVGSIRFDAEDAELTTDRPLGEYAVDQLGLSEEDIEACLVEAGRAYREVGAFFKETIPHNLDVTDLLMDAKRSLFEEAMEEIQDLHQDRTHDAEQQANLKKQLGQYRERAARDPLTELLNRGGLLTAMEHAVSRNDRSLTVMFIDLDDFKRLNDCFGHQVGDGVLRAVSQTLDECAIEYGGMAARYGGEEFIIMVPGLEVEEAERIAVELVDRVHETRVHRFDLTGPVSCSSGVIWAKPNTEMAAEELIGAADQLMYTAKRRGKNQSAFARFDSLRAMRGKGSTPGAVGAPAADGHASADYEELLAAAESLQRSLDDTRHSSRGEMRSSTQTPCRFTAYVGSSPTFHHEPGLVHNYSKSGLGLLSSCELVRGGVVELSIMRDGKRLYIAGIVTFARKVYDHVYEAGVQVSHRDWKPILSAVTDLTACEDAEWLPEVLNPPDAA